MSCVDPRSYTLAESTRAKAVVLGATIKQAVLVAEAIDNFNDLYSSYKAENRIADRTQKLAEKKHKRLKDRFWQRELDFLDEFGYRDDDIEGWESRGRRHAGRLSASVAREFSKHIHEADCNTSRYATSAKTKAIQDLLIMRSAAMTSAKVMGQMMGFEEEQEAKDLNDRRRLQAVALKDNLVGQAASLYKGAAHVYGGVGKAASHQLANNLEAMGQVYQQARSDWNISQDNIASMNQAQMDVFQYSHETANRNLSLARPSSLPSIGEFQQGKDLFGNISSMQLNDKLNTMMPSISPTVPTQVSPYLPLTSERMNDGAVGPRDTGTLVVGLATGIPFYADGLPKLF